MVTSSTPPSFTFDDMFVNNNQMAVDQPFICVDGYLLSCQYDGESCTPVYGIEVEHLLTSVKNELDNVNKKEITSTCQTPTKIDKPVSKTSPRTRRQSKSLFRQNSKDSCVRRSLFSESDNVTGISCQTLEQPLRNSFILPLTSRRTTSLENDDILSDIKEKYISKNRRTELATQVKWVEEHGCDYINTETVSNCSEILLLLNILMKSTNAALVTLKVNNKTEVTVTYQFMKKFKQDYMIVRINKGCCMLMKAF